MKLPGIKINRTSTGRATSVTISIKQYAEWIEDFLDAEYVKAAEAKGFDTVSWEEAKNLLSREHEIGKAAGKKK
jgi:hypothetical protein